MTQRIDYFYSDPHFGHGPVIGYCNRPFDDVDHMNREMIARYNSRVGSSDVVLWLGDCFLCPKAAALEVMSQLNGRKLLVLGNHDGSASRMTSFGFMAVAQQMKLEIAGRRATACHYPYSGTGDGRGEKLGERFEELRPARVKGEVLLHGHTHERKRRRENMIHCGVDAWDYAPASHKEISDEIDKIFT